MSGTRYAGFHRRFPTIPVTSQVKRAILAAVLAFLIASHALAAAPIPEDAQATIRAVGAAAARRDFAALDKMMIREFTWSFGGDRDARQALDAWRADPGYLAQLRRATAVKCGYAAPKIIECPIKAGTGHRAGFERTTDGWRMSYFVAGD